MLLDKIMYLGQAIMEGYETILMKPGTGAKYKSLLMDNDYYYTGVFTYASGTGIIPPCDVELYRRQGKEISEVEKWVRRGCFACK